MPDIRVILVGGFLGAGKTTTLARLARLHQERGHRVAIITNDHAADLVDTHNLRSQGFQVGEIPGGCFCGSIEDFTAAVDQLSVEERPDVLLVEPIGSCTDLAATVIRPLRQQYAERFAIAPYCVLLKPHHGAKILRNEPRRGVAPQAAYLFRKQLEEADVIAINRADQLSADQAQELEALLAEQFPETPVVRISARTGEGFPALMALLDQQGEFGRRTLELDYQRYAAAEAELGWLNATYRIRSGQPFDLDELLWNLVTNLGESLAGAGREIAHLKVIGLAEAACGAVNLVASDLPPERSLTAGRQVQEARLIVNARVAAEPALLSRHVADAIQKACSAWGLDREDGRLQSFRPGQPATPVFSISLGAR